MDKYATTIIGVNLAIFLSTIVCMAALVLLLKRIQRLKSRVKLLGQPLVRLEQNSENHQAKLDSLNARLQRFDAVDARLQRLEALDAEIHKAFGSLSEPFAFSRQRSEAQQRQLEKFAPLIEGIHNKISPLSTLIDHRFSSLDKDLYRQIESVTWLQKILTLKVPPVWTRGWAASPDLLLYLHNEVTKEKPDCVVELGSGISTIVIADALRKLGKGRLISIDHEPIFGNQTHHALLREDLGDFAEVRIAPITEELRFEQVALRRSSEQPWPWYDPAVFFGISTIDVLFVDGPTGKIAPHVRFPAMPFLADRLARTAIVLLDDAARNEEREIAAEWAQQFDMDLIDVKGFEKGLARLTFRGAERASDK